MEEEYIVERNVETIEDKEKMPTEDETTNEEKELESELESIEVLGEIEQNPSPQSNSLIFFSEEEEMAYKFLSHDDIRSYGYRNFNEPQLDWSKLGCGSSIPVLQLRKVAPGSGVNRIHAMRQHPHLCVLWADTGQLQVQNFSSNFISLSKPIFDWVLESDNAKLSPQLYKLMFGDLKFEHSVVESINQLESSVVVWKERIMEQGNGYIGLERGSIWGCLGNGVDQGIYPFNNLLDAACSGGNIDLAFEIMTELSVNNISSNQIIYIAMTGGCAMAGKPDRASNSFSKITAGGIKWDMGCNNILLVVYGNLGRFEAFAFVKGTESIEIKKKDSEYVLVIIAHVDGTSLWKGTLDQYLKTNHSSGGTNVATLCYISAGNVDKTVEIWSKNLSELDGKAYVTSLENLMEKTIVLALAYGQKRSNASFCKLVEKYVEILASRGLLTTVVDCLNLLGNEELSTEIIILCDSITCSNESEKQSDETTQATKGALGKIVDVTWSVAEQKNVPMQSSDSKFIRYKLLQQSATFISRAKERVIHMVEIPVDPLEPPKFKHKRVPKALGSPPVPVIHNSSSFVIVIDQHDWKILPFIINWKNPKGNTISLDKHLVANGHGLQYVQVDDNLDKSFEALYYSEQKGREAVTVRSKVQKEMMMKEKQKKEMKLLKFAWKTRSKRTLVGPAEGMSMSSEREIKLDAKDAAMGKKSKIIQNIDHDVSEKVAVKITSLKECVIKQRLSDIFSITGKVKKAFEKHSFPKRLVAYRLYLPYKARIHPTFYVSLLKKAVEGKLLLTEDLQEVDDDGIFHLELSEVVDQRVVCRLVERVEQVLIKWGQDSQWLFSWEDSQFIKTSCRNFDSWGQESFHGGGGQLSWSCLYRGR